MGSQLVGPGAIGVAGPTSQYYTTPFPHAPGDKARDKEGNEYLFCDFTATVYYGTLVQITSDYLASPLLGTARVARRVGVVMGGQSTSDNHPTSNHGGWVQVYGLHQAVQTGAASDGLSSDNTVAYLCIPQTSVGTPSGTLSVITPVAGTSIAATSTDTPRIYGMWVVPHTESSDFGGNTVSMWATSGASGPSSVDPTPNPTAPNTSGTNTSAYIGNSYAVFLNYPYVTGVEEIVGGATT